MVFDLWFWCLFTLGLCKNRAKLDLVTFITTMWTFLLILTIPLLLILYTSSFILGGEIQGGQILLEVNRVTSKKILIVSKYIVVILSILFYIS